ncbi:MAG: LysM peptidoglycan-binding domain-containing protein [Synechococcaceae cyanobacterium]|nr:LysM peptidoglycan-binding domain-containing protein [Synechococcaceae cyanobacterium]
MRRCFVALALAMVLPLPVVAAEVTVRPGETLSELAERHGVSVERLLKANGLSNPNHVEAGRKLILPPGASTRASASRPASGKSSAAGGVVVVQPGETLSEIAEREGVSVSRLMQLNGLTKADSVQAGARLVLGGATGASSSLRATASRTRTGSANVVVVRPGDTLSQIAEREGVSVSRLMQLNGISKPDDLSIGAKLVLGNGGEPATAPAAAATTRPKPSPAPSSFPSNASTHEVKPGESLSVIAEGYGVPISRLLALNGISDPNKLSVGTKLQLRGSVPATVRPASVAATPASSAATAAPGPSNPTPKPASSQPLPSRAASASPSAAASRTTLVSTSSPAATVASTGSQARGTSSGATANAVAMASASPASSGSMTAAGTSKPDSSGSRPSGTTTNTRPAQVATATASSRPAQASPTPSKPDWRTYGPLQVDWANWQPMGGSLVAPTLNADGRSLYLAINCGARKLNATSQAGQWKTWDDPQTDFESQIVSDLCKSRS